MFMWQAHLRKNEGFLSNILKLAVNSSVSQLIVSSDQAGRGLHGLSFAWRKLMQFLVYNLLHSPLKGQSHRVASHTFTPFFTPMACVSAPAFEGGSGQILFWGVIHRERRLM